MFSLVYAVVCNETRLYVFAYVKLNFSLEDQVEMNTLQYFVRVNPKFMY